MAKRRSPSIASPVYPDPIICLWLLRILVPLGGHREFIRSHGFNNDTLAEVLGLGHWVAPGDFDVPAFLRRSSKASQNDLEKDDFDQKVVLSELRILHQKAEKQWKHEPLPDCLQSNVRQLSELVGLSPADCRILEFAVLIHNERLLDDAADWSVVRSIRDELGPAGAGSAFERLISNVLEAQGHRPLTQHDPNRLPEIYDPVFIHADADLSSVAAGIVKARSGRLCLYGPPGTGKTAYGRWLAQQLDSPLLVKRASDLMSPFVGENEQNIALAFRQAAQDGALLLIDEVDSFLQDRRGAQRGWEVSLVNEMLTQMESFPGVFIASTNLMTGLDQAALRRFDLKVKFDFLRPEQVWELLRRHCIALNFGTPQPDLLPRVMRLFQLTPGDFAAVLRQHRFRPIERVGRES